MSTASINNPIIPQTLFDSAATLFNDYYKINSGKVNIMRMVQDLLLTVQNVLAGIALVSQSPVDEYSSNWEIKTSDNKPIVVLQYHSTSELPVCEKEFHNDRKKSVISESSQNMHQATSNFTRSLQVCDITHSQKHTDSSELPAAEIIDSHVSEGNDCICPLDYVSVYISDNSVDKPSSPLNVSELPKYEIQVKKEMPELLDVCHNSSSRNKSILLGTDENGSKVICCSSEGAIYSEDGKEAQTKIDRENNYSYKHKSFRFLENRTINRQQDSTQIKPDSNESVECIKIESDDIPKSCKYSNACLHSHLTEPIKDLKPPTENLENFHYDKMGHSVQESSSARRFIDSHKNHEVNIADPYKELTSRLDASLSLDETTGENFQNKRRNSLLDYSEPHEKFYASAPIANASLPFPLDPCLAVYINEFASTLGKSEKENSQHVAKTKSKVSDEKQYLCRFCAKPFKRLNDKKIHERIHTGEKPYSCNYCSKKFSLLHNCKTHELIHTGEKPYICRYCRKGFTYLRTKKYHELVHEGGKPYARKRCNSMENKRPAK